MQQNNPPLRLSSSGSAEPASFGVVDRLYSSSEVVPRHDLLCGVSISCMETLNSALKPQSGRIILGAGVGRCIYVGQLLADDDRSCWRGGLEGARNDDPRPKPQREEHTVKTLYRQGPVTDSDEDAVLAEHEPCIRFQG